MSYFQFTTSAASLQPQQISTNVTVKATTNGSTLKYEPQDVKPMKIEPMPPAPPDIQQDFKQEPDNEFADLVNSKKLYFFRINFKTF